MTIESSALRKRRAKRKRKRWRQRYATQADAMAIDIATSKQAILSRLAAHVNELRQAYPGMSFSQIHAIRSRSIGQRKRKPARYRAGTGKPKQGLNVQIVGGVPYIPLSLADGNLLGLPDHKVKYHPQAGWYLTRKSNVGGLCRQYPIFRPYLEGFLS